MCRNIIRTASWFSWQPVCPFERSQSLQIVEASSRTRFVHTWQAQNNLPKRANSLRGSGECAEHQSSPLPNVFKYNLIWDQVCVLGEQKHHRSSWNLQAFRARFLEKHWPTYSGDDAHIKYAIRSSVVLLSRLHDCFCASCCYLSRLVLFSLFARIDCYNFVATILYADPCQFVRSSVLRLIHSFHC